MKVCLFALAMLVILPAHAASFDCAGATMPMEKTICENPSLSKADEELAKAYDAALKPLSPEGQRATRTGQRSWLRFVKAVCVRDDDGALNRKSASMTECLLHIFPNRQKQLEAASPRIGRFQFFTVPVFTATTAKGHRANDEDVKRNAGMIMQQTLYPQIDKPDNNERAWNLYISEMALKSHDDEVRRQDTADYTWNYRIDGAWRDVISVTFDRGFCCGAHGISEEIVSTRLLDVERDLTTGDIFARGPSSWMPALQELLFAALKAHYAEHSPGTEIESPRSRGSA